MLPSALMMAIAMARFARGRGKQPEYHARRMLKLLQGWSNVSLEREAEASGPFVCVQRKGTHP